MQNESISNTRIAQLLNPKKVAIIVVDVMDAYCDPNSPLPKYLINNEDSSFHELDIVSDNIVNFLSLSRTYPILTTVFVRMLERSELVSPNIGLKMEIEGIPQVAQINGEGWNYYKVKPNKDDKEIIKYSYDSFFKTNLDVHLKTKGVETVVIVGGHASVCVDTTARTAAQLGYHTFVPADLTADPGSNGINQTPDVIREKLYMINSVLGYMPLSSSILKIWGKWFDLESKLAV